MLSYMLPVDEKPPPGPGKTHLQLTLGSEPIANGRTSTPISKDTSISSFASDATTATASHSSMTTPTSTSEKGKPKLIINGGKHQTLKRVSFGSSKGSMVETLIFESPVQEEPESSPILENVVLFPADQDQAEADREKVRVTFFQQSKPLEVDLPDEPIFTETDFMMASPVTMTETNHVVYNRTESIESGWDNPFRPGGDLSREADEIVELIKGGKPITPTPGQAPPLPSLDEADHNNISNNIQESVPITESPKKATTQLNASAPPKSVNGTAKNDAKVKTSPPGAVDIQRGTVKPAGDALQAEHVTIKKKPKCKCCVIQ
ncbi:uncharacterized protein LOC108905594 [Anoplophora glabripennis]|uniref:uncharacterized protein LOC108905594 n=1 Tax=Anoplophora glabripennis TaxID=217634 RepID=UPI000873AE01|nr:uncharacterized protein LOC108905594 [Anoplophora glabripennis]XP_018564055.1 uncharacterized protein LOC108905594 [Anoplophora glabripennis]XP_018564056.1 uncharacterized protein LOC108905594 [Anoplophora glabripennis]